MKIYLRFVKCGEGYKPCTALENIEALGKNPNTWMLPLQAEQCRQFKGTEQEAEVLLTSLEKSCTESYQAWENYQ